jgi:arabinose-5-phosphate isomerase
MEESIKEKLNIYNEELNKYVNSISIPITKCLDILLPIQGSIFITGIGKSAHIAKKCVATWQSLGIQAHYILIQDIFHGDLGVIRDDDIIIYLSNSGNTEEIVSTAKYIQENIHIPQIAVSNNIQSKISPYVNYNIILSDSRIKEADVLNKVPSVSSVMFMIFLDVIGIQMAEMKGMTDNIFTLYHPAGDLSKKNK